VAQDSKGWGRLLARVFITFLFCSLIGVIGYLMSDINATRFRLRQEGSQLLVERGKFLPMGFESFKPEVEALEDAYKTIALPKGTSSFEDEVFQDRADLDRALFTLLAGFARKGLSSTEPGELRAAAQYIGRCDHLPGLSEQQRVDLRTLRADLAFRRGQVLAADIPVLIREALSEFRLAKKLGTSRPTKLGRWIQELEHRLATYFPQRLVPAQDKSLGAKDKVPVEEDPLEQELIPLTPSGEGESPHTKEPPSSDASQSPTIQEKWKL
jgi:hypothetical protein